MPWSMAPRPLTIDLATGNRLQSDPVLQLLILTNIKWELDAELKYINQSIYSVEDLDMREVHDLAAGMRQAIAGIKQAAVDAKNSLSAEISHAQVNAQKVNAMTADLKAANQEVDGFLGDVGSNFPPSGVDLSTPPSTGVKADVNGVTLGVDTTPSKADVNGITLNPDVKQ